MLDGVLLNRHPFFALEILQLPKHIVAAAEVVDIFYAE